MIGVALVSFLLGAVFALWVKWRMEQLPRPLKMCLDTQLALETARRRSAEERLALRSDDAQLLFAELIRVAAAWAEAERDVDILGKRLHGVR